MNQTKPSSNTPVGSNVKNVSVGNNDAALKQITQLQVTVDGLEKERDFYFGKLRDIEIMVQSKVGKYDLKIVDLIF